MPGGFAFGQAQMSTQVSSQALVQSFQVQGFSTYARNSTLSNAFTSSEPADPSENLKFYLGVYVALSVAISLFGTFPLLVYLYRFHSCFSSALRKAELHNLANSAAMDGHSPSLDEFSIGSRRISTSSTPGCATICPLERIICSAWLALSLQG